MGKAYSTDLRQRVFASVFPGDASRRKAATQSTASLFTLYPPPSVSSLIRRITSLLRVDNSLFSPRKFPVISTDDKRIDLA